MSMPSLFAAGADFIAGLHPDYIQEKLKMEENGRREHTIGITLIISSVALTILGIMGCIFASPISGAITILAGLGTFYFGYNIKKMAENQIEFSRNPFKGMDFLQHPADNLRSILSKNTFLFDWFIDAFKISDPERTYM